MSQYLGDKQYIAFKVEAVENTPVKPNIFVPLIAETIETNLNRDKDNQMSGVDFSRDLLDGRRTHEGPFEVYADPDTLGHLLNMLYKKGTTTGDASNGYTHPFTAEDPDSYTIEVGKGLYAKRFYGVKADKLRLEFDGNKMKAITTIKAAGQWSVGTLDGALSGAVTELYLKQNYDVKPNEGLIVGDVIVVGGVDVTLTSVNADGLRVGFGSISITAADGDPVYLKRQDYSHATLSAPFLEGNCLVGVGVNETASTIAAATRAAATPTEGFVIEFSNNLLAQQATGKSDPIKIVPQTKEIGVTFKKLFENTVQLQKYMDLTKQAMTIIDTGKYIKTDHTTHEKLTIKLYNVKLNSNKNPIKVGEYIYDEQDFKALYDATATKAVDITLVNKSAATVM